MTDVQCLHCGSGMVKNYASGVMQCHFCRYAWQVQNSWQTGRKEQVVYVLKPGLDDSEPGKWFEVPAGCLLVAYSEAL